MSELTLRSILRGNDFIEKVTPSGHEYIIRTCPLDKKNLGSRHPEYKTYVNPDKGMLKCFVCHGPGEGLSLKQPARRIERMFKTNNTTFERSPLPPIPMSVAAEDLPLDHPASLYLGIRGCFPETCKKLNIRYKANGVQSWGQKLSLPGFILPLYVRTNLVGWQFMPFPRKEGLPKYITAPGSVLSSSLYNIDNVASSERCVVTEGVFDCVQIPEMGVSILSDNLGAKKVRLLSSMGFKTIYLMLDGDRKEKHIQAELSKLNKICRDVRLVRLPADKDPGDFTRAQLLEMINNA